MRRYLRQSIVLWQVRCYHVLRNSHRARAWVFNRWQQRLERSYDRIERLGVRLDRKARAADLIARSEETR